MKLYNFILTVLINKLTKPKIKPNNFFEQFNKTRNYFAMSNTKLFKHVQTQHSDDSFDLDNILLCKANLFHQSAETDSSTTSSGSGEQVVEVENDLLNKKEPQFQNTDKRKADDSERLKEVKKAKLVTKTLEAKKANLDTKSLEAQRPGFSDDRYLETSYYIENGLRKVYPYNFTFTTYTKGRWVGQKVIDVFSREFRAHAVEEYERSIQTGKLTVNNEKVPVDYRLKHNDLLANTVHRHEVPVTSQPIRIVHIDNDIVVVNKPASIPVHPCGRYRHNTIVFILAKEYNLKNLRTLHRLDRLTSGLLLFGRNSTKARQMEQQIRNRKVQKEYICRVEGEFPEGVIESNEPIEVVSYKIGVCKVSDNGKDCKTTFERISYNGKTSVVLCKPLTGRMHQIRVHLQYLGYPIVNDPLYNHDVFGPLKGRGGDIGGRTNDELVRDLIRIHNAENWLGMEEDSDLSMFKADKDNCDFESVSLSSETKKDHAKDDNVDKASLENASQVANNVHITNATTSEVKETVVRELICPLNLQTNNNVSISDTTVATQTGHEFPDNMFKPEKMTTDAYCNECKVRYRDPEPKHLVMYLHAWKYKGAGWEYETALPNWGSADWIE